MEVRNALSISSRRQLLAPLRRSHAGAFMPIMRRRHYAEHRVAPLRRSRIGAITAVSDTTTATESSAGLARLTILMERAERIRTQQPKDKNKLYALHAPEVECIGKVRREVAHIIVSAAHKVGDETGRSVGRSLPVHAWLATAACEATGTTYRAFGPRRPPRGSGVTCQHQGGWDARLSGMVNRSELLQASLCMTSQRC